MAITTYAELQTAVASWLDRDDRTSEIPDFITLAEATFNYGEEEPYFPPLRTRWQETSTDLTMSSGSQRCRLTSSRSSG